MKRTKKLHTPVAALLLAVMMTALLLTGCGAKPAPAAEATPAPAAEAAEEVSGESEAEPAAEAEPEATPEPTPEPTPTPLPNGSEFMTETVGEAVETPYITLYCPEDWAGIVDAEHRTEDGMYKLSFSTYFSGKKAELFTLMMGESDTAEGFPLGMLKEDSGTTYIFIAMNEQDSSEWSPEDYGKLCSMQERVNDLIMQFHEDERFDSGRLS